MDAKKGLEWQYFSRIVLNSNMKSVMTSQVTDVITYSTQCIFYASFYTANSRYTWLFGWVYIVYFELSHDSSGLLYKLVHITNTYESAHETIWSELPLRKCTEFSSTSVGRSSSRLGTNKLVCNQSALAKKQEMTLPSRRGKGGQPQLWKSIFVEVTFNAFSCHLRADDWLQHIPHV